MILSITENWNALNERGMMMKKRKKEENWREYERKWIESLACSMKTITSTSKQFDSHIHKHINLYITQPSYTPTQTPSHTQSSVLIQMFALLLIFIQIIQ